MDFVFEQGIRKRRILCGCKLFDNEVRKQKALF